jgi:methanogenic corrinoid protein MtbC1
MVDDTLLGEIAKSVREGYAEKTSELVAKCLANGVDPILIVDESLSKGVREAGEAFGREEIFLTDLMLAAEAMKAGMKPILPLIQGRKDELKSRRAGSVLMATVEGDIHDIGKNLCCATLSAGGFEVVDMGVDVTPDAIMSEIDSKSKEGASVDLIGLSCLMTLTKPNQKRIIELLKKRGTEAKTMVGGAPCDETWAKEIGADAYGRDASNAVEVARKLIARARGTK